MKIKIIFTLLASISLVGCGSDSDSGSVVLTPVSELEESNDDFQSAQTIELNSEVSGTIAEEVDPEDFFKVVDFPRGKVEIRLTGVDTAQQNSEDAPLDVDVDVFKESLEILESSYTNENEESISTTLDESGTVYVKVSVFEGGGTYTLSVYQ